MTASVSGILDQTDLRLVYDAMSAVRYHALEIADQAHARSFGLLRDEMS